ncbi:MAG: SDR family NAD(P)-dependent oxidoreductase [Actinomycetota bacterium]|nr:SDR family NAD(P)-dependent oxidoreductase [Actinomycetota bacterium]
MTLRTDFAQHYGPWALVTGAAQGIGAAYAQRLHSMGMPLVLVDVLAEQLETTAQQLRSSGSAEVRTLVTDLSDAAQVHDAVAAVADLEIGLLVANAGIGLVGRWLDVPIERKQAQIAINCTSVVILADGLTRKMVERKRGGVIIMSSGSADAGSSYIATYAATKAFDRVFAEGLWAELSPHGIDVTAVMPGATATPGFAAALPAGLQPTKVMQPGAPSGVVDAALNGLGRKLNVRPGGVLVRLMGSAMSRVLPRKVMIGLGDKAVRGMYERGAGPPPS